MWRRWRGCTAGRSVRGYESLHNAGRYFAVAAAGPVDLFMLLCQLRAVVLVCILCRGHVSRCWRATSAPSTFIVTVVVVSWSICMRDNSTQHGKWLPKLQKHTFLYIGKCTRPTRRKRGQDSNRILHNAGKTHESVSRRRSRVCGEEYRRRRRARLTQTLTLTLTPRA